MNKIDKIKMNALAENIPIIDDEGLRVLKQIIINQRIVKILEIGSAVGYSALQMASINQKIKIVTIEKQQELYEQARQNIRACCKQNQIKIINDDALNYQIDSKQKFDLIYIDGAKAQYQKFFEKYQENLSLNGIIVFDNLLFHGYVKEDLAVIKSRNLRQLVKKLQKFNNYLTNLDNYQYLLIEKGDGIGVLTKKENNDKI